jgi:predicted HTH domain antitoxin
MECEMNQIFMSEQEFSDYMDEKEKAVIKNATPEIRKQAIIETITELYDMKQISLENAANKLNLTVPQFEELLKQQRKSA